MTIYSLQIQAGTPQAIIPPVEGDVHVWTIDLQQAESATRVLEAWLSDDERQRAARFHFEHHRRQYTLSHIALRAILGGYTQTAPEMLRFQRSAHGKPFLADTLSPIQFNLSHSAEIAMLAITSRRSIGVDIEKHRPIEDVKHMARKNFSPAEYQTMVQLPAELQLTAFFNAWTRKEAFIKCIGDGLYCPLDSFEVTLTPGEPARLLAVCGQPSNSWAINEIPAPEGYIGAVAIQSAFIHRLTCYHWKMLPLLTPPATSDQPSPLPSL